MSIHIHYHLIIWNHLKLLSLRLIPAFVTPLLPLSTPDRPLWAAPPLLATARVTAASVSIISSLCSHQFQLSGHCAVITPDRHAGSVEYPTKFESEWFLTPLSATVYSFNFRVGFAAVNVRRPLRIDRFEPHRRLAALSWVEDQRKTLSRRLLKNRSV